MSDNVVYVPLFDPKVSPSKCKRFSPDWAREDPRLSIFVEVEWEFYAVHCVVCEQNISTLSTGRTALVQHLETQKHRNNCEMQMLKQMVFENNRGLALADGGPQTGESASFSLPREFFGTQNEPAEQSAVDGETALYHGIPSENASEEALRGGDGSSDAEVMRAEDDLSSFMDAEETLPGENGPSEAEVMRAEDDLSSFMDAEETFPGENGPSAV